MPDNLKLAYEKFINANKMLQQFIQEDRNDELSRAGIVHGFEFTFELFWKFLQRYLEQFEVLEEHGPSSVIKKAFEYGYLKDGQKYMDMLRDRNLITHTYNEETAKEIYERIKNVYINTLQDFIKEINEKF